ncbi:MAG: methyltransferase domain-containing protein [Patescibacteria group bacterium]
MNESTRRRVNLDFDREPSFHHIFNAKFSCPYLKNKKVLDIGCWTGQFEQIASKYTKKIVGIDPGIDAIKTAKRFVLNADFYVGDALNLKFKSNSFDTVTILDVIEHIPRESEEKCLKEIGRVLKPNGYLIISTPHSHPLSILLDPAYFLIGHRHYSEKKLRELLSLTGFKTIKVKKTGGIFRLCIPLLQMFYKHILKRKLIVPMKIEDKIKLEYDDEKAFAQINIVGSKI